MIRSKIALAARLAPLVALASPALSQEPPKSAPSPNEIVDAAPASDWVKIAPRDLLVMTLAPAADGSTRKVVIQLMPAPFSLGWVDNIRTLARDHWYDGIAVVRVQDNYVVQWGDPNGEDPAKAKPLPKGLKVMSEGDYASPVPPPSAKSPRAPAIGFAHVLDAYAPATGFTLTGWPVGSDGKMWWPVHCYGMVGVGRNYSPDTGTGAELYTVIGTPPRHLDRNIALVGRVIEGMEFLSSLPRGHGPLGFYQDPAKRVPILSVRLASDLPAAEQPHYEYLSTESQAFAKYADARANRRDPFFIHPAGGADICNIPVPVRPVPAG
ncbi:peptidylprolyl isomerase [Porphyrobacter algicida]|uniref:peptidylprolyl isomerase n=1 Tax=Qipengyuania algicida TaxID=1836209 RepID=A0A845AMS8_9SPHN|nr:peptidylprolyl isomerase [Qipengyuania algicida]MXP29816.1 peptidylprolyl isomerase [Qipengyuania algicida]